MRKTLLFPTLLCIAIVAGLFVPNVSARGGTFVIQPKQEAIEEANATIYSGSSVSVTGKIMANGSIDFYVTSPSGALLLSYTATNDTGFSFAPHENGTYLMHLANTHSTENVTALLTYGFNYVMTSYINLIIEATTQSSVTSTVSPSIPPPEDRRYQNDPYAKFLNFVKTSEILRNLNEELQMIRPMNTLPATVIYSILVMYAFGMITMHLNKLRSNSLRVAKTKRLDLSHV